MENKILNNLQQAIELAFEKAKVLPTEQVHFLESAGRILAQDVYSDVNMPPFNKSAMDGYACRKEDLGAWLQMLEVIPAGQPPLHTIGAGQCSKIMTGAAVPKGADTVFMVEQSEVNGSQKVRFTGSKTNSNICLLGEDVTTGERVLTSGTRIKAQHIAMLAAVGCTKPEVYQKPKVGIISTGSELVEPDVFPQASQIRNSNGHQMNIQAQECLCVVNYYGTVEDDEQATFDLIKRSTAENDVTLISGGVSVGDFDYVPEIIRQLGFEILFNKIAVKPGKHTTFAFNQNKYIIGLPGNPVSSFIQFEIFAKPFLLKLMNFSTSEIKIPLPLASDYERRKSDREEFIPVKINAKNEVETIRYHGSAHIHAYHEAYGFMTIPEGIRLIKKGETVYVRPL
ncbi:molybdopterin molybdotransferase MoeA [Mangrovibacterium lignilyticum]|uniref:molybdopterin molybdotransferase MoeA n=1 Tax=Mangrovibacterium lignilyticum TaxID=2668052 RepID=UPI0013D03973|nr:gephyrin-like molybdotransferase Glp [Mangrovibacterium lignilyticum]